MTKVLVEQPLALPGSANYWVEESLVYTIFLRTAEKDCGSRLLSQNKITVHHIKFGKGLIDHPQALVCQEEVSPSC